MACDVRSQVHNAPSYQKTGEDRVDMILIVGADPGHTVYPSINADRLYCLWRQTKTLKTRKEVEQGPRKAVIESKSLNF